MGQINDIVVGGGLVGAAVARRLSDAGRQVTLVENGRAVSSPPGAHLRNSPALQADPDSFFSEIDQYFDYVDVHANSSALPGAFTTAIAGGMGVTWTNNCPRAVAGVDRPLGMEPHEWDRFYELAEDFLEVRSGQFDDSRRRTVITEQLAPHLAAQGRELVQLPLSGVRTAPERIRYVAPFDVLGGASGDVKHVSGTVERVEFEAHRAVGVLIDGEVRRADNVVLAAGALEIPKLLWKSGFDLSALGRYLSFHPVLMGQIVLETAVQTSAEGTDPLPRIGIPPTSERPWFVMLLRDTNPFPVSPDDRDVLSEQLVEVQVFAPVDPHVDNVMSLTSSGVTHFDVPLRENDERRRRAIEQDVSELCAQIGRFRHGCQPQWNVLGTPHLMGSSRMGPIDDGTSVTDFDGRVWGSDNLYLASNGLIPTRLAVNPTLTTVALALHTADQIVSS